MAIKTERETDYSLQGKSFGSSKYTANHQTEQNYSAVIFCFGTNYEHLTQTALCLKKMQAVISPVSQSVSQVRVAFAAVSTALHCKRSCAGKKTVSVRDMAGMD